MLPGGCPGCVFYEKRKYLNSNKSQDDGLITHPSHYCDGRKYEPIKVIQDWNLDFALGSALKYIARAGRKPGNSKMQDLLKAKQYLDFEIENLEDNKND